MHRWTEHPYTDIWMMSWGWDERREGRWYPGQPFPQALADHVAAGGRVVSHSAAAERLMWNKILIAKYKLPLAPIKIEQQDCTLARAVVLALPPDLERAAEVMGSPVRKDAEGSALMKRMAKPKSIRSDGVPVFEADPARIERLGAYCDTDVDAEIQLDRTLPLLTPNERQIWMLDQRMNDRGIKLDIPLITIAHRVAEVARRRSDEEIFKLTNGAVSTTRQADKIAKWLTSRGIECTSVAAEHTDKLLEQAEALHDKAAAKVIAVRRANAKAAVSKFEKMLEVACPNGRAYGLVAYHIATTGRWAGRLIQPQNLLRVDEDREAHVVDQVLDVLRQYGDNPELCYDLIDCITPVMVDKEYKLTGPMPWLAKCCRSMFIADDGMELYGADLSNIEGRLNAYIAGETWKVEAFRAFDAGVGSDLYIVSYAKSFNCAEPDVTKAQRQIGKVQELALGYQGSVGAYLDMGKNYGLRASVLARTVFEVTDSARWAKVGEQYDRARNKHGLSRDVWTGLKICVDGWRQQHPHIVQGWWDLQDAAISAISWPGTIVDVYGGRVRYCVSRGFLWCSLPSGRVLAYKNPRIAEERVHNRVYYLTDGTPVFADEVFPTDPLYHEDGTLVSAREREGKVRWIAKYEGLDDTNQWRTLALYGGMQCNHVVQGTARCVIADKMMLVDLMGYNCVLTVHDEIVSEVLKGFGCVREYEQLVTAPLSYLPGLPLAAKAWKDVRYG